jgi:hypothetical protein
MASTIFFLRSTEYALMRENGARQPNLIATR